MLVAFIATLFFLLLHVAVARYAPGQEFHVQLKLSRGLASIILTAIGFYALSQWWTMWPQAFLSRHQPGSEPYLLICFVSGHLIADFLLLGWGALYRASSPRKDLVAHHVIGLVVCAVVFYYGIGHTLFAVALTTEMMPVTSGIGGMALWLNRPALERSATQLRLTVLTLWRLPFWALMIGVVLWRMTQGEPDSLIALGQRITLVSVALLMLLDLYWVRLCLSSLRETPRQA